MQYVIMALLVLAGVGLGMFVMLRRKTPPIQSPEIVVPATRVADVVQPEPVEQIPQRIVIGEHHDHPLMTIEPLASEYDFSRGKPLEVNGELLGRLGAMLQAAPAVLIAASSSGRNLMEVVINGSLTRAADGNGLRAFAMGPKGIIEHSRLFSAQSLQNMISAAAVWQIASVIVAQKHLADINRKLEELKAGIRSISQFLDNQRKARIESTFDYLQQIYQAIGHGELSGSVRHQLESCERDLLEIQRHLEREFQQKVDDEVKHTEMFGTEQLTNDLSSKIDRLEELAGDMVLCLKTRIASWHVLSLYPGEQRLKQARRSDIEETIEKLNSMTPYMSTNVVFEINRMKATWNKASTLDERKSMLTRKVDALMDTIYGAARKSKQSLEETTQALLEHDRPMRVLLEINNGMLVSARQPA